MKTGKRQKSVLGRKTALLSEVERSGGNVFADLRLSQPEERLARAKLAHQVCEAIAEMKLTQTQAAAVLGVDQPKVSALLRGKLDGFSTDRLFRFLNALGRDIDIVIRPQRARAAARIRIVQGETG